MNYAYNIRIRYNGSGPNYIIRCYGYYRRLLDVIYLTVNYTWRNDFFPTESGMQRSKERARAWLDDRRHELAGPGRRISGQTRHTGQRHHSQESRAALGKRKRGQSRSRSLEVVDR